MKKYVFLAFILIFGTSILSGYMTYIITNSKNNINTISIPQNIFENVDNTSENIIIKEQTVSEIKEEVVSIPQEEIIERTPVIEDEPKEEQNKKSIQQVTQIQEKSGVEVKEETTKIENNNNTPQLTKENKDKEVVETPIQQEITEKKDTTNIEGKYMEIEVSVAEKKECDKSKHRISSGNTGLWFETKEQAIATYKAEIKKWGDKWSNNEISDEDYYSNCPYGYEIWDCPFCSKWTINYYFDI